MGFIHKKVRAVTNYKSHIAQITEGKIYEVIQTNLFGDYLILDDENRPKYCFSYKFVEVE